MKHIYVIIVGLYVRNVAGETERSTNIIQETDRLTERLLAGHVMMPSGNEKGAYQSIGMLSQLRQTI